MQHRACVVDSSDALKAMAKRKPPVAPEIGTECDGNANGWDADVEVIIPEDFGRRPSRPQGNKAVKGELKLVQQKQEATLRAHAQAMETMAEANLQKSNTL